MHINDDGNTCYSAEEIKLLEEQLDLQFVPLDPHQQSDLVTLTRFAKVNLRKRPRFYGPTN